MNVHYVYLFKQKYLFYGHCIGQHCFQSCGLNRLLADFICFKVFAAFRKCYYKKNLYTNKNCVVCTVRWKKLRVVQKFLSLSLPSLSLTPSRSIHIFFLIGSSLTFAVFLFWLFSLLNTYRKFPTLMFIPTPPPQYKVAWNIPLFPFHTQSY